MNSFSTLTVAVIGCGMSAATGASPRELAPTLIEADRVPDLMPHHRESGPEYLRLTDAAAAVARLPGVSVARNGQQTGILQVRGLTGDRVGIRVDGMTITPACPNHMDPPLHYANLSEGTLVDLFAGVSPVSEGGDSIGGSLSLSRPTPVFASGDRSLMSGRIGTSFVGSQDAVHLSGDIRHATNDLFLEYNGSATTADDLRIPGGSLRASGYDMTRHGIRAAWKTATGFLEVDAGMLATRDAGTPALPMDMVRDDAWNLGVRLQGDAAWGSYQQRIYIHDIEHLMDNYSVRPLTAGMPMEAPSTSRDLGWQGDVELDRGDATLRFGLDLHRNDFDAEQVAVASGLRRDMFADNVRSRYGAYADWEHAWNETSTTRIGLRSDLVTSKAGAVSNQIMPMPPILADQAAFNAADRSASDWLVDVVAAWRIEPDDSQTWEMAVAMKNRAPSLVERYLWTPLGASAGLADGRTYLGDPGLDPEQSYQISLGYEKRGDGWRVKATPFYQSISDYILGLPIARNDAMGRPVLKFSNIDRAELYGFELEGGYAITPELSIDASASHVRGRNRETGDDLYRIAPFHGMVDLAYQRDRWAVHLESEWAAAQNRVSTIQGESSSAGYALFHLRVARTFERQLRIEAGVENLLDKRYADHLGGVNRVGGSAVAMGSRIPGAGRFAYVSLSKEF